MRDYEVVVILRATLGPDKIQEDLEKVKETIRKQGGVIQEEQKWGSRSLSYPIKKKTEGFYVLIYFQIEPSRITALNHAFRLMEEEVIRALVLVKEELPKPKITAPETPVKGA